MCKFVASQQVHSLNYSSANQLSPRRTHWTTNGESYLSSVGVLQHIGNNSFVDVRLETVARSKLPSDLVPKAEPRQLKSLGTDAFIASSSCI